MKKKLIKLEFRYLLFLFVIIVQSTVAQVGINTTSPDASSALDVTSTTQGILSPRMTTAQKLAITTPANGLMVYDTDLKGFSYYDAPAVTWVNIMQGRSKFKRIKSTDVLATILAPELAAGGGTKYVMDTQTLYEINGQVVFNFPIEINNSYIIGLDSGEDKIVKFGGDLFVGTTGGSIRVVTLANIGGNVFNITAANTENLIFRDLIIANSANVGTLNGFGFVFSSIVQYSGNSNGIVYNNITKVLLSNQGWFGNNSGTYETFTGTFELIGKQGGFTEVNGASIGVDVSSDPVINVDASMNGVVFTGVPTTGFFVKKYTTGSYTGFSFNNKWEIDCSGIPLEGDSHTVGDVNMDLAVGFGFTTTLTTGTPIKVLGTTAANNFFRASTGASDNRLQYLGYKKRFFTVSGSLSFNASNNNPTLYIFYIAKNGVVINRSKTYVSTSNTNDTFAVPLQCQVELSPNDYVEIYVNRYSGTSNMLTVSLNLFMK